VPMAPAGTEEARVVFASVISNLSIGNWNSN
jgi:hypothetical protein